MINIITVLFLLYEAYEDIRWQSVSAVSLFLFGVAGLLLNLVEGMPIAELYGGVLVGLVMIGISVISKGGIGLGDGVLFVALGLCVGGTTSLLVVLRAMALASLAAVVLIFVKGGIRETKISFVPLVFLSYLEVMLAET